MGLCGPALSGYPTPYVKQGFQLGLSFCKAAVESMLDANTEVKCLCRVCTHIYITLLPELTLAILTSVVHHHVADL